MKITRQKNCRRIPAAGNVLAVLFLLMAVALVLVSCTQNIQESETGTEERQEESSGLSEEQPESIPEEQLESIPEKQPENVLEESAENTQEDAEEPVLSDTEEPAPESHVVVIDPGHQKKGDSTQEPNGPDSSVMKARVAGGTSGRTTGVPEYELTLTISLKLRDELEARGYTVYMTRESHDVNISNMERALYASSVGAEIAVRIHANGSEDTSVSGALALTPSSDNPYISHLASESMSLSKCILDAYCNATSMDNKGIMFSDTMTGINWSTVPVTILEMGFMTNPADDTNMQDEKYQQKMVQGIADGIDAYF